MKKDAELDEILDLLTILIEEEEETLKRTCALLEKFADIKSEDTRSCGVAE
ncbi:MAG: hypothetical protein ABJN75_17870 [Hoeflea sp.]|uniref:hypothetical protein n=1 Tax=Hoeflea sp. TaxID=1940281 RepID=UPI00329941E7